MIPVAKQLPQEIQKIGKTIGVLYPVGGQTILDCLYQFYENWADVIVIITNENKEEIYDYSKERHREKLHIVEIEEIRDLGYTLKKGFAYLENIIAQEYEVIINFGDTLICDDYIKCGQDIILYSEEFFEKRWTFFEQKEGVLTEVIDKKEIRNLEGQKGSIFTGVFSFKNALVFQEKLLQATDHDMDSFYQACVKYSQEHPFEIREAKDWLDIGHSDKYVEAQLSVKARVFNDIQLDTKRGILTKKSINKNKFRGEILWYANLPDELEYVHPRIFDYSIEDEDMFVKMEYYAYQTIHDLYVFGNLTYKQWYEIFDRIKFIYRDMEKYKLVDSGIQKATEEMYLQKTLTRMEEVKANKLFQALFENEFRVNDIRCPSLSNVLDILVGEIKQTVLDCKEMQIIHGDLCFANILIDSDFRFIKVIDPRGAFGDYNIYGDARYEIAKLFHSFRGNYDCIISDRFDVSIDKNTVVYKVYEPKHKGAVMKSFLDVFDEIYYKNKRAIDIIEILLFMTMIPLHSENEKHQLAMLATGIMLMRELELL